MNDKKRLPGWYVERLLGLALEWLLGLAVERLMGLAVEVRGLCLLLGLLGSCWRISGRAGFGLTMSSLSIGSVVLLVFWVMIERDVVDFVEEVACRGQLMLSLGFLLRVMGSGVVVADGGVVVRFLVRLLNFRFFRDIGSRWS